MLLVRCCHRLRHCRSVCDISCIGGDYGTALQAAAARGHEAIVQDLLQAGADPNVAGGCFSHCMRN
jgi:hypothetical protein